MVCAFLLVGVFWYAASRPWSGTVQVTPGECISRGGVITDPFNRDLSYQPGEFLGEVSGLRCSCVCLAAGAATTPAENEAELP
ncbi:MAG: hypothetical protein AAB601_02985 [Patescibacteria group bacterium]